MAVLGVDFGTSNSAAAVWQDGAVRRIALEGQNDTLPTAVFFDFDSKQMLIGSDAGQALLEGEEGRYMRALKNLLGTTLMRERRSLLGERLDFIDIVARFLARLKSAAEDETGERFDRVLSGRPVQFHPDPRRNAQAEVDLREAYLRAGFVNVTFMFEPEAAAWANRAALGAGDLGLVVDIGGGTSDFTLFRHGAAQIEILANHGVRLGGTDFDRALSLAHVMPHLGRGARVRHAFGDETHVAPSTVFNDLATWAKIPFLYAPETRRLARDLARNAVEKAPLARLVSVLEDELGHDVAFAVEDGKIGANMTGSGEIDLGVVEKALGVTLSGAALKETLDPLAQEIGAAVAHILRQAGVGVQDVTHVVLVGGSSLMQVVAAEVGTQLPSAVVHRGAALTAIVDGLAQAAADGER